jgi:serine/threonine protein kinase
MEDNSLWDTSATKAPGTVRWKAPELLSEEQPTVTVQSDMYAFGMTCLVSLVPAKVYCYFTVILGSLYWTCTISQYSK